MKGHSCRPEQLRLRNKASRLARFRAAECDYCPLFAFVANRRLFSCLFAIYRGHCQTFGNTRCLKHPKNRGEITPGWQGHCCPDYCGSVCLASFEVVNSPRFVTLFGSKSERWVDRLRPPPCNPFSVPAGSKWAVWPATAHLTERILS